MRALTASTVLLAVAALSALLATGASAVSDSEELTRFGSAGSGAGQFSGPGSIGTDPVTGHVFTADSNNRINEFTAWGNFVKAFGWDVAPGAVNEQQEVRVRASTGQFKLTFGASTTTDLAFDAPGSASEGPGSVEAALNALPSIGEVNVEAIPGTPNGATPYVYVIAFKGSLAATDVGDITASNGTASLDGGDPTTSLEARTRADGTAGGVGLESCTEESGCQKGLKGSGAGQFSGAGGLAVDSAGNVYAREIDNLRVQKFDSAGRFVWMAGGEVDKTTNENLCTAASGHQCGIGTSGTAAGQFSGFTPGLALGSGGQLFAADNERIQRFNLQGEFQASFPVPGEEVRYLAFDPVSKGVYATWGGSVIHKLDPTAGTEIGQLAGQNVIATDLAGNVYAQGAAGENQGKIVQYDSGGKLLTPPTCCEPPPLPSDPNLRFSITGLGTNAAGDLYVSNVGPGQIDSFIRLLGPGPVMFEAPPKVPPEILSQYATSVDRSGAVLSAEINPHFWTNTRFYVQYGTGKCSEGGCTAEKPVPPGQILSTKPTGNEVKSPGVFLEGLKPGTTYHYRFVAESTGGGPVRGTGGEVGVDGEENSFTTYPTQTFKTDCPNQQFRTGFSAPLSDCRAYEMVSPIDKNSGDIKTLPSVIGFNNSLEQSSVDGERFTYSAARAFAEPEAGDYTMQYLASRKDGVGWVSEALNPAHSHAGSREIVLGFEDAFKAFSPDLCQTWLVVAAEPMLDPNAPEDYYTPYRRENCGPPSYETLIGVQPTVKADQSNAAEFQGASADSKAAIFRLRDKLTEDATSDRWQAYYASERQLRLLCVLPEGTPSGGHCSGGTGESISPGAPLGAANQHRRGNVTNAISADGSRVYWTDSGSKESGPGKVYLRLNPGEEQSEISGGECLEAEKACTVEVSGTKSTKAARFLMASPDGARALFEVTEGTLAGNLYLFDLEAGESSLIASETVGLVGASEDLSRVYFASDKALSGTSGATAGKPNLYLDEGGTKTFIATLSEEDVSPADVSGKEFPSNTTPLPIYHAARATPDGSALAFISTESLTGYDNTDQVSGETLSEVYLYEAGSPGPVCVSCNPSGARPLGRRIKRIGNFVGRLPAAATLTIGNTMLQTPRALSADGSHLFFDSFDALLPRDTNGKADVYEWQAASGEKECKAAGAELYVEGSGGCLSLISSGQSPSDSQFLDANEDGSDVFFTTNASLLPQDPGLIDVYDARVGGGLPGLPEPPGPCQGEACQIAPPPPTDPTPASATFRGAGNLKPAPRCRKGKVARKGRCVAKKRKATKRKAKRATNRNRGASR